MMKRFSGSHSRSSGLTLSAGAINKTKQQEQKNKTKKKQKKNIFSHILNCFASGKVHFHNQRFLLPLIK